MPFKNLGLPELIVILIVAVLVFGPGRIGKLGSELGKGIRGFKDGLKSEEEEAAEAAAQVAEATTEQKSITEA